MHLCSSRSKPPRGLAPLEMVLALPFLLSIMALMVIVGNAACWKIRALTVARHAIWGNLSPALHSPWVSCDRKTGFNDPRPAYWNAETTTAGPRRVGEAEGVTDLENSSEFRSPQIGNPNEVVRGLSDDNPILAIGSGRQIMVDPELLKPSRGMRAGAADLTQPFPMLRGLGSFRLGAETQLLDDAWRAAEMGIPVRYRRLDLIYPNFQPPQGTNPVLPILITIYRSIHQMKSLALLYGNDSDYLRFQTLYGVPPPQPALIRVIISRTRLGFGCSMDPEVVERAVDDLVDRISGSRRKFGPLMAISRSLEGYYDRVLGRIEARMHVNPSPSSAEIAQLKSDKALLERYLEHLEIFMASLSR